MEDGADEPRGHIAQQTLGQRFAARLSRWNWIPVYGRRGRLPNGRRRRFGLASARINNRASCCRRQGASARRRRGHGSGRRWGRTGGLGIAIKRVRGHPGSGKKTASARRREAASNKAERQSAASLGESTSRYRKRQETASLPACALRRSRAGLTVLAIRAAMPLVLGAGMFSRNPARPAEKCTRVDAPPGTIVAERV